MYRGLTLGNRVRLTDAMVNGGFIELAAPMPVGTILTLSTAEGVAFEVTVIEVREQGTPGMVVRPIVSPAAEAWWGAHVGFVDAAVPVDVVRPKRRDEEESQLVDDGRKTVAMAVVLPVDDTADAARAADLTDDDNNTATLEAAQPVGDDNAAAATKSEAPGRSRRRKRKR